MRYRDNTGQNKAKKEGPGALEASFTVLTSKVGQSTQLLPVLQINFRFDHDVFRITVNFTTFAPFQALLKVLPVSELYSRATDLDLVHPVFL